MLLKLITTKYLFAVASGVNVPEMLALEADNVKDDGAADGCTHAANGNVVVVDCTSRCRVYSS
ncbi:MAG: hypothetical protein IPP48_02225 [Chitinophagaceae bacterium]|nr:hypothetical protein [Chitinophagaceae bacterium]